MSVKKWLLWVVASLGVVVALALLVFGTGYSVTAIECRARLNGVGWLIKQYCEDHTNHFPPDVFAAAAWIPGGGLSPSNRVLSNVTCPGTSVRIAPDISPESDYTYINWEQILGTTDVPETYPLMFDKNLSNHGKRGINVLPVRGKAYWDFRAQRLKAFAAQHPEYHLPLPQ